MTTARYLSADELIPATTNAIQLQQRGLSMENTVELVREIEALKREAVQRDHSLTDALADLRRKVQSFEASIATLTADVSMVRGSVTASISPSQIRSIALECLRDPSACATVRAEAQKAVSEALAKAEAEEEEAGSEKQEHQSALDYLRCPECRDKFVQASSRVPEFTSAIFDQFGDRDVEGLIRKLQEQGYLVEKKEAKVKDWLTGV